MGRVYLGLSPAGRAVAIKVVNPDLARDSEFLRRFGQEVAAARAVSGIYTAPVVASGLEEHPPWLATAFVPGPSLDQVVSEHGPMPEPALWPLLAGLIEALQAIHACGVVHRDLKPANVLLASDGPRVIDFGISRATDGTALTAAGVVFGTPGYMSPEQAEGKEAGPASDVFALGCVIAYASTGAGPFGGGTAAAVLYRVVHGEPAMNQLPPRLRDAVTACLAKDPAVRPTLAALAAAVGSRDARHRAVRRGVLAAVGGQRHRQLPDQAGAGDPDRRGGGPRRPRRALRDSPGPTRRISPPRRQTRGTSRRGHRSSRSRCGGPLAVRRSRPASPRQQAPRAAGSVRAAGCIGVAASARSQPPSGQQAPSGWQPQPVSQSYPQPRGYTSSQEPQGPRRPAPGAQRVSGDASGASRVSWRRRQVRGECRTCQPSPVL